jgi:hypothetical protein
MPVVFSNPAFPFQVGANPASQAYSVQLDYGSMLREVCGWNSAVDAMQAGRMINNRYRQIIDRRKWYGTKVRGNAGVANVISNGTATVTAGSNAVTGVGTTWTSALIGLQFRNGFTQPYQTITNVLNATSLTLDTPFQGLGGTFGYQIVESYLTFGANIKRLEWAVNQLFGWPMQVNVPVEVINEKDTWRQNLGWARIFATRPPTPDGQYQVEVWPTPYNLQVFPFEAYTQPADMVLDGDCPVAWIRSDLLVAGAICDALKFRPKKNEYYDPATALAVSRDKKLEFDVEVLSMENADELLQQQAVSWDYSSGCDEGGYGSVFSQMHE